MLSKYFLNGMEKEQYYIFFVSAGVIIFYEVKYIIVIITFASDWQMI